MESIITFSRLTLSKKVIIIGSQTIRFIRCSHEEADQTSPLEHLAEARRRLTAWVANRDNSFFVYLMAPKRMGLTEFYSLRDRGIDIISDFPCVL